MSFAGLLLVAATGCSSDDSGSDDAGGDPKTDTSATSTQAQADPDKPLTFDVAQSASADLASDECAQPYWSENSTGADGQVDFRQLDCWAEGDDPESLLGGVPELIQTVIWVEFGSADEARAYAAEQLSDRTVLVAGPTVLVASPFPWGDDAAALVTEVQGACGCGVVGA